MRISDWSSDVCSSDLLTHAYGAEIIATSEDDYDFARGARVRDFYTILGLTGQVGVDRTDSLLDPTKGFRITALVQPEGSLSGKFTPSSRGRPDVSGYYPVTYRDRQSVV